MDGGREKRAETEVGGGGGGERERGVRPRVSPSVGMKKKKTSFSKCASTLLTCATSAPSWPDSDASPS
jgi:hypothetical protein